MHKTLILIVLFSLVNSWVWAQDDVTVAKDGSGDYISVQAAVDAAPQNRTTPFVIHIKNGVYKEQIDIPSDKPFLQFIGESVANTILTYDNYSGKPNPEGGTFGTSNSASVIINADNFTAVNITFENTTGDAPQALAVNVSADKAAFKNCRFLGGQDTLLTNRAGDRQYYKNCYIDGVVDFIFGPAIAVFDSCVVYAKSREDGLSGSYITAANTPNGQAYGYVFRDCILPSNTGVTQYVLGRPWQNAASSDPRSYPKVVFLNTTMGYDIVKPEGWSVWNEGTVTSEIFYAEYKSRKFNDNPIDVSQRVDWSFQLSETQAAEYTLDNLFGDWDPCTSTAGFCDPWMPDIAVSNFKGNKGEVNSDITWNISWPIDGVKYELFRSSDSITFTKVHETIATSDTTVNFNYSEAIPQAGTTYYYYLVATKDGMEAHQTAAIELSSTPTINTSGSLKDFRQGLGLSSAIQGYYVSGENLSEGITITSPEEFEVSDDKGTSWHDQAHPLVIPQNNGVVESTPVWVRLNAGSTGTYSGNIVHTSSGAATKELPVSGEVQSDPLPVSETLAYWPFVSNNEDDPDERSEGVLAGAPVLHNFYLSNGTTVSSIPDYSNTYGQAFGPGKDGEALWTTANEGPGGHLNRKFYQEFSISAAPGYSVRIDSIVLNTSYYNTVSHTNLAIVYSKSSFTADSSEVTGGIGPDGNPLVSTANGGFETPASVFKENGGTTMNYRFALAGSEGVTLSEEASITLRLYFSCGSTSKGRYAKLKDVFIKGETEYVVTATRDKPLKDNFKIWPNPVNEWLTVRCADWNDEQQLAIYNSQGQKVMELSDFENEIHRIDLSDLAGGIYFIETVFADKRVIEKIIKN